MNINQNINKLLYALKIKGQFYKINSFQFYSEKNDEYSTKYQVLKEQLIEHYNFEKGKIEYVMKYEEDYDCYSKIDLLKYFIKEYKGMG